MIKYATKHSYWIKLPIKLGFNDTFMYIEEGCGWDGSTAVCDIAPLGSCIHDIAYHNKGLITVKFRGIIGKILITRKEADQLYKYYVKHTAITNKLISRVASYIRYNALRLVSWMFWRKRPIVIVDVSDIDVVYKISHHSIHDEDGIPCDFIYVKL